MIIWSRILLLCIYIKNKNLFQTINELKKNLKLPKKSYAFSNNRFYCPTRSKEKKNSEK